MGDITKIADDFIDALDGFSRVVHDTGAYKDPAFLLATMAWADFDKYAHFRIKCLFRLPHTIFKNPYLDVKEKMRRLFVYPSYPFTIMLNYLSMPFRLMFEGRRLKQSWWWCIKETSRLVAIAPYCLIKNDWKWHNTM